MTGLLFEIADKSTEQLLTWREAVEYVKTLGDGWRLPTIKELNQIYNSDNRFVGGYWSSESLDITDALYQDFFNGKSKPSSKFYNLYVRAVKDNL